jgi:acetolactate synthase-1/2/3 large subunit
VPIFFISGQARASQLSYNRLPRQIGSQESNVLDYVRPITKRAVLVTESKEIPFALEDLFETCLSGRPGPVWLDLPVDVQWADLSNPPSFHRLSGLVRGRENFETSLFASALREKTRDAQNPVVVAGGGLRQADNSDQVRSVLADLRIPVVATWAGFDFVGADCPSFCGLIGPFGHPAANALVENADLVLSIGADLGLNQVRAPLECKTHPRQQQVVVFCENPAQLSASPLKINDVFLGKIDLMLDGLVSVLTETFVNSNIGLADICRRASEKNKIPSLEDLGNIWPVPGPLVVRRLTEQIKQRKALFIDGGGTALYAGFQASLVNAADRVICSTAMSSMGTALDEYVGASSGLSGYFTYVIIGDGSMQMSLPSLGGVAKCRGPAVILVLNNSGYSAIRHTQRDFLGNRRFGVSTSDVSYGALEHISRAFGLSYFLIDSPSALAGFAERLRTFTDGVVVCEAMVCSEANTAFSPVLRRDQSGKAMALPYSEMRSYWDDYNIKRQ